MTSIPQNWEINTNQANSRITFSAIENRVKSVREVLDRKAVAGLFVEHEHDIKASLQFGVIGILVNVFLCRSGDVPAFGPGDSLQSGIYRVKSTCFHLDKDEMSITAHDDINFPVSDAEIFTQQFVTFVKQELGGDIFANVKKSILRYSVHGARKRLTYFKSTIFCEPQIRNNTERWREV